jgi:hypothetical protein
LRHRFFTPAFAPEHSTVSPVYLHCHKQEGQERCLRGF